MGNRRRRRPAASGNCGRAQMCWPKADARCCIGKLYAPAKEMLAAAAAATPPADVAVDLAIAEAQVLDAAGQT